MLSEGEKAAGVELSNLVSHLNKHSQQLWHQWYWLHFSTDMARHESDLKMGRLCAVKVSVQVKNSSAIKDSYPQLLAVRSMNCHSLKCQVSEFVLADFGSNFLKTGHCCLENRHHIEQRQRPSLTPISNKEQIQTQYYPHVACGQGYELSLVGRQLTGLTMTFRVTLLCNTSHSANDFSPRCGSISPCAVRQRYPDPWTQSFFGITATTSDSRGRYGHHPLWPSSMGHHRGRAMLCNTVRTSGSLSS